MIAKEINRELLSSFLEENNISCVLTQLSLNTKNNNINIGFFNKDNVLIGYFIIEITKRLKIFNQITEPLIIPNNALYFKSAAKNTAKKNGEIKKVMTAVEAYLSKSSTSIVSVTFPAKWKDFQVFTWKKYKVITRLTYTIALKRQVEDIFNDFARERKKNINQVKKDNILIEKHLPNLKTIELITNTFTDKGIKVDINWLNDFILNFCKEENCIVHTAKDQKGNILATNLCIYDSNKCYYLYGGYNKTHKHQGAGAACMWQSIQEAKSLGVETFDFEGSMIPEIEKYFRNFGGDLVPFYQINKASLLQEMILKIRHKQYF